jgi:hypothetical protein
MCLNVSAFVSLHEELSVCMYVSSCLKEFQRVCVIQELRVYLRVFRARSVSACVSTYGELQEYLPLLACIESSLSVCVCVSLHVWGAECVSAYCRFSKYSPLHAWRAERVHACVFTYGCICLSWLVSRCHIHMKSQMLCDPCLSLVQFNLKESQPTV